MPDITDSIIFIEDDDMVGKFFAVDFDRHLTSLIQSPKFSTVRAIIIGRFQKGSYMTREKLEYIVNTKAEIRNIPILANVDFGHTNPMITFPIGGRAKIKL
jgi:muramoyltetrapeptide carboxypeptidase LdcA involved in peptidoglycan recycling